MLFMLVTLDKSHLERSPMKLVDPGIGLLVASKNRFIKLVIADTSHDPIGPCGPLEQSHSERRRHCIMALCRFLLVRGAQIGSIKCAVA